MLLSFSRPIYYGEIPGLERRYTRERTLQPHDSLDPRACTRFARLDRYEQVAYPSRFSPGVPREAGEIPATNSSPPAIAGVAF